MIAMLRLTGCSAPGSGPLAVAVPDQRVGTREPPAGFDMGHQIFYAALEGLYADGVDNGTVDRVLAAEDGEWQHFA